MVRRAMAYAEGSVSFAFQGGEPTLVGLDFFRRHVELCNKYARKDVRVFHSIQTNGYAIDEEWAQFFAQNKFLVGLSLDGPERIHDKYRKNASGEGTFERIQHTVKLFDRYHVDYNFLCVVTEDIARNADEVMQFFLKSGISYLQFIPCLDGFDGTRGEWSLSPEQYGEFLVRTFKIYLSCFQKGRFLSIRNFDDYLAIVAGYPPASCGMCGKCTPYFVLEGDGSVYPCDFYVLDEYCCGNINTDSLFKIRKSENFLRFEEQSLPVAEDCLQCSYYKVCRGGCRRYRDMFAGNSLSLNYFCKSYKRFFSACGNDLTEMTRQVLARGNAKGK